MNKKLIVANWKMKPETLSEAEEILEFANDYLDSLGDSPAGGKEFSLVFCPPFVFIEEVGKILGASHLEHEAELGAQDIAIEAGLMLQKLNVRYVIVGHSERRWKLNESNEVVNQKLKAVLRNAMVPIVCIGEKTRDSDFKKFLENQVDLTFKGLTADEIGKCIIAYEPVWAISTNLGAHPDTPESALESINIIKKVLFENYKLKIENSPKVLYGGSVNSSNVTDFIKKEEINGVLVGGASVNKEEFVKMLSRI